MQKHYTPIKPVAFSELKDPVKDRFGAYRHHGPHAGIDIYKDRGTGVKASLDGKVVRASWHGTYGNLVIIDHTPEIPDKVANQDSQLNCYIYTLYAHLDHTSVSIGKQVRQGDIIGKVGNTGNAKGMDPHLHFETIRAPKRLKWKAQSNTGIEAGLYRIDPLDFLGGFSLPEDCFEPLSSKEMDDFYKETKTDLRLGSKPALLVDLPDYKEFIKKERGTYPSSDEKPPKVRLDFQNDFSKEFRSLFPTLELVVNGKNLGSIRTGWKIYELDIWR